MSRVMSVIGILAGFCLVVAICTLAGCPRQDSTPLALDQESAASRPVDQAKVEALIDRTEQALNTNGSDVSAVLSDPRFLPVHGWPRFRDLVKAHATGASITVVTPQEPGKRLRVKMRLIEANGSASVGALVYFYHTDALGDYGPNNARVPLTGSDNNYSRLFGYATTDSDGTIKIETVRPGGYPDSTIPAHIHLRIWCPDRRSLGSEIWFEDDPRINHEARAEAARFGIVICPVAMDDRGHASIDAKINLD